MRIGLIGTGAIAEKHAQAYQNIGFSVVSCTNRNPEAGRRFAAKFGARFVPEFGDVCEDATVDWVDVCTFPDFRLPVVEACARAGKHVQVQKPIATSLETAQAMIRTARNANIRMGVVSQHRFDDAAIFLVGAIAAGRLGRLIQCDCYVKWHRSAEYYARPVKGTWQTEGGGALINQAIHQVDLMRVLAGPVREVFGYWQLGAAHCIESEDVLSAVVRYQSGATGVIQAATAIWPGYPERIELHGTKGTAIVSGDQLVRWDVMNDADGEPTPPVQASVRSGASDPMAISLTGFERQFLDFAAAIRNQREPLVSGEEGYRTLEVVDAIYRSCRLGKAITLS